MSDTIFTPTRLTPEHIAKRPSKVSDLADYRQLGESVGSISLTELPLAAIKSAGDFLLACDKGGLVVTNGTYHVQITKPLSQEELDRRIAEAVERFDNEADRYDAALVSGTRPEDYTDRTTVESYSRKMNLTIPWEI